MYTTLLLLCIALLYVNGYGENICKVPNGDAGRCVNILRCKPLWDIYSRKRKTPEEHTYIRQSFCGDPSTLIVNVCCPSVFVWPNFEPIPVYYYNPLDDLEETPYTLPTYLPTKSPATEIPQNNNAEELVSVTESTMLVQNNNAEGHVPVIESTMLLQNNNSEAPVSVTESAMLQQNNNAEGSVAVTESATLLQNNNAEGPVSVTESAMLLQNNNAEGSVTVTVSATLLQNNNAEGPVSVTESAMLHNNNAIPVIYTTIPTTEPEVAPLTNSPTEPQILTLIREPYGTISNNKNNYDNAFTNLNNTMTCGVDQSSGNRITGGDATAIDAYPWLVLLEYPSGAINCGGSLITPRFVLTAAHCADSPRSGKPNKARLAEYNISSFPTDIIEVDGGGYEQLTVTIIEVENVWTHPNFTSSLSTDDQTLPVSSNDIGLVKLAKDVEFNDFIQIVCLPYTDFIPEFTDSLLLTVAGWGEEKEKTKDYDIKKHVKVPYVPIDKCRSTHPRALLDTQICAGGEEDKASCIGDSGGPLMYSIDNKYYAVGVVSYGREVCGTKGQPAVYTNVYKYIQWISDIINGTN